MTKPYKSQVQKVLEVMIRQTHGARHFENTGATRMLTRESLHVPCIYSYLYIYIYIYIHTYWGIKGVPMSTLSILLAYLHGAVYGFI